MRLKAFEGLTLAMGLIAATDASAQLASKNSQVENFLRQFGANPKAAMEATPPKFDSKGNPIQPPNRFGDAGKKDNNFVDWKREERDQKVGRAKPGRNDQAQDLVDNSDTLISSLTEMERSGLLSSKLAETPWSDTYWPIYQGVIAARYADDSFPKDEDWKKNKDYTHDDERTFQRIFDSRNSSSIDDLSPAEKYDLLVGDTEGNLTQAMWDQGREYYESTGKVESWMGICHGWAPAAYMVPRPQRAVTIKAADGKTTLRFYPSDIKALASLLWASVPTESRFISGRCNQKNPKKDPQSGRVLDRDCFDTNPMTWHLSVVNQIGKSRRSFVMDATFDYEVWNQPVYSYSYTYFNPQTGKHYDPNEGQPGEALAKATIPFSEFTKDKFKKFRDSPDAVSVVGVAMDVTYVVETEPSHDKVDSPSKDETNSVRYLYDLELDAKGNVVGGEWYSNKHPDFLWTPPAKTSPITLADRRAVGDWDPAQPMPKAWQNAAVLASRSGQPLSKVVLQLVTLSRVPQ